MITDKKQIEKLQFSGYKFSFSELRAYFFVKKTSTGYLEMRCLPSDLTLRNLNLMAKLGLTNTNKAKK
jgi:hypothetical protein